MALTARQIDALADEITRIYGQAEAVLLRRIARALAQGLESPRWASDKLLEIQLFLARCRGDLNDLAGKSAQEIARMVLSAYNLGQASAIGEVALAGLAAKVAAGANPVSLGTVQALIGEAASSLLSCHQRILRDVEDAYRQVVRDASAVQLTGAQTRREAAQAALNSFADRGITGFVDRAGRRWEMQAYTEMAMRTAARRASTDGHLNRLQALGQDLVYVSDHGQECSLCRPWEGKVLSISGAPRLDGVHVAGTVEQARADGFLHPGCRHTLDAYLPGFTKIPPASPDPRGDADRQRLRCLERQVRAWKRREMASLGPAEAAQARAKVRAWQAEIRSHVQATGVKRQPFREQVGSAR